ncbi:MAG TPA: hypothetical protein VIJ95_12395 [Hanamia sp.]
MPKEKNMHAVELIGSPEKFINALMKSKEDREWTLNKITVEGPPHKQLQHTLVLNRLEKLVNLLKKSNGMVLKPIKGKTITSSGPEHETILPIDIPLESFKGINDVDNVIEKLSKGPEHEILYTALLLQAIEGMIASEKIKNQDS